jgi:hypothetical protein
MFSVFLRVVKCRALAKQRSKIVAGKIFHRSDENREVFLQFALCFSGPQPIQTRSRDQVVKESHFEIAESSESLSLSGSVSERGEQRKTTSEWLSADRPTDRPTRETKTDYRSQPIEGSAAMDSIQRI